MSALLNTFKRHYRKTDGIYKGLAQTGSFSLTIHYKKDTGTQVNIDTPDPTRTVRFVMVMRRFLDPSDRLYYRTVWAFLQERFGDAIPQEAKEAFAEHDCVLSNGSFMRIEYNGEALTPEGIYHLLAEGEYFNRDEETRAYLMGVFQIPMAGELFWYQFYDYTVRGFTIASIIFAVIQELEKQGVTKDQEAESSQVINRCIFCLSTAGAFTAEEHIVPEALGNHDDVLPRGYVCDSCNNGVLARLDDMLCNSPLFALQRVNYVLYDKKGRLPESQIGRLTLRRTGPLNVLLSDPNADAITVEESLPDNWTRFSFSERLHQKFDERVLARALCKIGLEVVALNQGQEYVCSDRFNAVRAFITKGTAFHNNLLMRTKFTPQPQISVAYLPQPEGTVVEIHLYGLIFLLNLEEQPVLQLNDELRKHHIIAFRLHGKANWKEVHIELVADPATLARLPHIENLPTSESGA